MKNVTREIKPESLIQNADEWKRLVLENKDNGKEIPPALIEKYKQTDVKESLTRMYSDEDGCYCCYCEAQIDDVDYPHIEHRKPKSKFPECAFDWDNLHLACPKCNIHKGNQWDEENEILDATVDPIKDHLSYREGIRGIYRETLSKRGITTVEHADLDRLALLKGRKKVYDSMMKLIREIQEMGKDPRVYTRTKILMADFSSGQYGSLIKWLIDSELD
ncbi:MAG: HNH endonuclease [Armatimonadota bacterium]